MNLATTPTLLAAALVIVGLHVNQATPEPVRPFVPTKLGVSNLCYFIHVIVLVENLGSRYVDTAQLPPSLPTSRRCRASAA